MIIPNILSALFFIALGIYIKFNPEKAAVVGSKELKQKASIKSLSIFYFYSLMVVGFLLLVATALLFYFQVELYYNIIASLGIYILLFAVIIMGQTKYLKN